jgi:hypothetical protein
MACLGVRRLVGGGRTMGLGVSGGVGSAGLLFCMAL